MQETGDVVAQIDDVNSAATQLVGLERKEPPVLAVLCLRPVRVLPSTKAPTRVLSIGAKHITYGDSKGQGTAYRDLRFQCTFLYPFC
jgi:hypothetical protein